MGGGAHYFYLLVATAIQRYVNEVDKMWRRTDIKMTNPLRNFETVFSYYLSYHGENDVDTYKKIADITQR